MKTLRWVLFLFLLGVAGAAAQSPTTKSGATVRSGAAARSVATVRELHDAMTIPASDAVFNTGREAPRTEQQWAAVRNAAIQLTESGNLLMIGSRVKDTGAWMKLSRDLVDAGEVALRAAEAKNMDALSDAGDRILLVCETCHKTYRDKGRRMPARR